MTINTFASRVSSSAKTPVTASDSENAAMLIERVFRRAGINGKAKASGKSITFTSDYAALTFTLKGGDVIVKADRLPTVQSAVESDSAFNGTLPGKLPRVTKVSPAPLVEFTSVFTSFYTEQKGLGAKVKKFADTDSVDIAVRSLKSIAVALTRLTKKVKN